MSEESWQCRCCGTVSTEQQCPYCKGTRTQSLPQGYDRDEPTQGMAASGPAAAEHSIPHMQLQSADTQSSAQNSGQRYDLQSLLFLQYQLDQYYMQHHGHAIGLHHADAQTAVRPPGFQFVQPYRPVLRPPQDLSQLVCSPPQYPPYRLRAHQPRYQYSREFGVPPSQSRTSEYSIPSQVSLPQNSSFLTQGNSPLHHACGRQPSVVGPEPHSLPPQASCTPDSCPSAEKLRPHGSVSKESPPAVLTLPSQQPGTTSQRTDTQKFSHDGSSSVPTTGKRLSTNKNLANATGHPAGAHLAPESTRPESKPNGVHPVHCEGTGKEKQEGEENAHNENVKKKMAKDNKQQPEGTHLAEAKQHKGDGGQKPQQTVSLDPHLHSKPDLNHKQTPNETQRETNKLAESQTKQLKDNGSTDSNTDKGRRETSHGASRQSQQQPAKAAQHPSSYADAAKQPPNKAGQQNKSGMTQDSRRKEGSSGARGTAGQRPLPKQPPKFAMPEGFRSGANKSIAVTFHALVHRPVWEWDENTKMYIRFSHPKLGNWNYDCGPLNSRMIDDEFSEMTGTFNIAVEIFQNQNPIPYKYTVFSPKVVEERDCYEYLHDYRYRGIVNRCLQASSETLMRGTLHHYDTIVFSKNTKSKTFLEKAKEAVAEKGIFGAAVSAVKVFFTGGSKPEDVKEIQFNPPNLPEMAKICLPIYLQKYSDILSGSASVRQLKISVMIKEIEDIYQPLSHPVVIYHERSEIHEKNSGIIQVMNKWMESIVQCLKKRESDDSSGVCRVSSLVVALCCYKLSLTNLNQDFLISLLQMLRLTPHLENRSCPDYDLIRSMLPDKESRESAADATSHLVTLVMKSKVLGLEWLATAPLIHFLKGYAQPFEEPEMNPDKILQVWGKERKELKLNEIKCKAECGFVDAHFKPFQPLFVLDPRLLLTFIYIVPNEDYHSLFEQIPPYLSTTWLSHKAIMMSRLNANEASEWIALLHHLRRLQLQTSLDCKQPQILLSMVDASMLLCQRLIGVLKSPALHYVNVVGTSISLFLCAIFCFNTYCPNEEKYSKDEKIKKSFLMLEDILWKWIADPKVIGGSLFGYTALRQSKEELELWQALLNLEYPSDPQITEQWYNITKGHIRKRVLQVPVQSKIDLVCQLEKHESIHHILTEVLMEVGMQAVDDMLTKPANVSVQGFNKLVSTKSTRVGKLLGSLLKRRYSSLCPETNNFFISFDDLLQWYLWPNFISVYESKSQLKEGLPPECHLACMCAVSKLQKVCDQIVSGNVTMKELENINKHPEQMKRLCDAAATESNQTQKQQLQYKTVSNAVKERLEEYREFKGYQGRLSHLCTKIHFAVQGLPRLKQELRTDFSSTKINTLCMKEQGGAIQIQCFQSASTMNAFVENFCIMSQKYVSDIFHKIWVNAMENALKRNPTMKIEEVHDSVWKPAFSQCQSMLDQLYTKTMKLADIDRCFKQYQNQNLELQLMNLFDGINACLGQQNDSVWIKQAVLHIINYWNLCNYRDAANTFLQLQSALNLKGDFGDVERLSTEVTISMKEQTLAAINDVLIETGQFLEHITSNLGKLQCLQTFAACQQVIQWIREETENVTDLQNFVNVALATAAGGEGDFAHDRLSNLRTVGSGFGSLIYNLPEDAGYHDLSRRCTPLWDALQNNPLLPQKLEGCNDALDWYKSVKETQGSVEVTSFGKMEQILKYGHYRIGPRRGQAAQNIHDVITLSLVETEKPLPKTSYSLDDLRDLESKLVLITGSEAENRKEVDKFLKTLHSVCRIAEVLIALQQAGNVKYTVWVFSFPCVMDSFNELQTLARQMETELQEWNDEVKKSREEFYELNYYTTLQLLSLRSELGKVKSHTYSGGDASGSEINPAVLALLHSVSPEIDISNVEEAIQNVLHNGGFSFSQTLAHTSSVDAHDLKREENKSTLDTAVLASADTQASVPPLPELPEVKLTQEELTDRQKEIFANLVDFCEFSPKLVLIALEKYQEDEFEVKNWCMDNAKEFEFPDGEDQEDEDWGCEELASEDSDSEDDTTSQFSSAIAVVKSEDPSVPKELSPKFSIKMKQTVGEAHPDVQRLMDLGFTAEQSMKAIEQCGSVSKGMDSLMSGSQGGVFQPTSDQGEIMQEKSNLVNDHFGQSPEEEFAICTDIDVAEKYLSLNELGSVLQKLNNLPAAVSSKRTFPKVLKTGQPNLLMTFPENVLKTTLSLYMEDENLPLPTHEEVLVCYPNTTTEQVTLLWQRAIGDPDFKRIFCLVHAEKLSYQVCDKALRALTELSHGKAEYRLVIICTNEDEEKSNIVSKLQSFRKQYTTVADTLKFQHYLKSHFTVDIQQTGTAITPAMVDFENSCVRVVSSTRSGMGKSLFIKRMANQLEQQRPQGTAACVTIPIHGPTVSPDVVLEFLNPHTTNSHCTIFHFDIAPGVLYKVDCILFCLLVLRGLSDDKGRVWRCHQSQLYAIEVTLLETQAHSERRTLALLELLPSVECASPRRVLDAGRQALGLEDSGIVLMDQEEFKSATFQRVYQYLKCHTEGTKADLDAFSYHLGRVEENPADCLMIIMKFCGVTNPSWSEVYHFVRFLDLQLGSCEESVFCDETLVGDVMAGLKSFIVKFMICMSTDFATPSLQGEFARENEEEDVNEGGDLRQYEIHERRHWEQSSHPYIFFNQDRETITCVGFMVTRNGDLIDPAHRSRDILKDVLSKRLYKGLKKNGVNFNEDYRHWKKDAMIKKIGTVMGLEFIYDPDPTYVLTVDNLIKMLAIQMRFRCGIPVVIMGETGCGKTRLIRYMCDLAKQGIQDRKNMLIIKIHGGITKEDVIKFIKRAEEQAEENRRHNLDTVVFFDEANTTEAIGLIKEVMCDRRLNGRPVSPDLKFIAACNPYRKHTEDMIKKLESAGLGFYVRDTQQKLGQIPLRQLVYRVLDLPPSMRPLVYDFGQLNTGTESDYTSQIVSDHVKKHGGIPQQCIVPIAKVLAWSQKYMRDRQDECSFVSLRDVERAMIVLEYFFDKMAVFKQYMDQKAAQHVLANDEIPLANPDDITRSLVLALSVCYHARLQERVEYEEGVAQEFTPPLYLPEGAEQFRNEIIWCQEVLLDNMTLGPNIARNAALRENIFMMAVCIELRIPLFLVGKPGSSKSLAKSIVANSMQGQASNSDLLKGFKQVHMFSYQCSQLSKPESVIEVFNTAKRFQKDEGTTKYVSVVVLDEVGLAEDSPNLPLKALHPLLEDGTEGADDSQLVIDREKRVAFIGISNWALDPAKMNRGVMVTRGDPDVQELELSARGICSCTRNDPVKERLEGYFQPLADTYKAICAQQKREFFGLRDFYSLIKMLYSLCKKSNRPPTWSQLEHAIRRNFGGLDDVNVDPIEEFRRRIPDGEDPDLIHIPLELHSVVKPDSSPLGLIKTSLRTKETTWHGENRYLLFLTENYAALEILRHYLNDVMGPTSPTDPLKDRLENMDPFILFGSSFPKDKEYTQVCRNINQIKICMETGRTVILLNLENLYESLYDVLNQYYIYHGGSRYVDLGLQTHRVKCRVHDNFKLILIAEKSTVYDQFPTPLINRLEKHFVLTSSVLVDWQQKVLERLQEWTRQFSCAASFKHESAFIGYQNDTPAAVVFQATNQLKSKGEEAGYFKSWCLIEQARVLGDLQLDGLMEEEENSELWKQTVFQLSQCLLMQTASPDAIVRLEDTPLADQQTILWRLYNEIQHHASLEDFLQHHLIQRGSHGGLLLQVTTHSYLLSGDEVENLTDALGYGDHISWFLLQEFDTELDFSNKVSPAFQREPDDSRDFLLIVQCDSGHLDGDLIACARYRIYDERAKNRMQNSIHKCEGSTHVLFVIHLPQQSTGTSFVGFQGNPWVSAHIDDLRCTGCDKVTLNDAMTMPISSLFVSPHVESKTVQAKCEQIPTDTVTAKNESVAQSKVDVEMQADMFSHDSEKDETEDSFETESPAHQISNLDTELPVDHETPSFEGPMEQSLPSINETIVLKESAEEIPSPKSPDDERLGQLSKLEVLQPITEPAEFIMESSIAEQPQQEASNEEHQPKFPKKSGYCLKLHDCIQAAASRLQDSAKNKERAIDRVKLLVDLIPRSTAATLDESTFHGALVIHIHQLLKEREEIRVDEKNWVLREALSPKKLQSGGTFRNVIARKLDEVIIPIFAEIIALIDHNYNLDLVDPKSHSTPVAQFWLAMFCDPKVMQFSYAEMSVRKQVPGVGGKMAEEEFRCQLPFSWLVREAFDAQWNSAKSIAGNQRRSLYTQLYTLVSQTTIGEVLEEDETNCKEFFERYLHDFVRSKHKCNHKLSKHSDIEYRLIERALNCLIHFTEEFATIDGHESFTRRIAALHVVHHTYQSHLLWFGQLASHMPGVLVTLEHRLPTDSEEMLLPLYAVEKALEMLKPEDLLKKDALALHDWLNRLRLSRNAIDSILSLPSKHETARRARLQWQLLRALQMFIEHIVLKYEGMEVYAKRLTVYLSMGDFLKASTINRVKDHLNLMDTELEKKKLKGKPKKLSSIRRSCRAFFMELVSTLCFGGQEPPEEELIRSLIDTVFTERQEMESEELPGTREFSYRRAKRDKIPVIRSFLLQLLLEHNTELVKAQLGVYFRRSLQARALKETADRDLYLLCTQCLEDALYKRCMAQPFFERLSSATNFLKEGHEALTFYTERDAPVDFLEGIAKIRYGLSVVAELLNKQVTGVRVDVPSHHYHGVEAKELLDAAEKLCTDEGINHIDVIGGSDTTGPIVYLLKLLVRQYGTDCLQRVSLSEDRQWVVPPELRQGEEEKQTRDPFVLYGQSYSALRTHITEATIGKQFDQLSKAAVRLPPQDAPLLLLALYEKVTLRQASTLSSKELLSNVVEEFVKVVADCKCFSTELQWMGRVLLDNEQGSALTQLKVISPLHQTLEAVVVHAAAVLLCRHRLNVLKPFINMLNSPRDIANTYLPTMPEDTLPEAQRVIGETEGEFYECPRGHPYLITECGRPLQQYTCPVCGSPIGGANHILHADNRIARTDDQTQTGYCLGQPEGRSSIPAPERSLSPAACCILRALMHSALLWASCNNQTTTEGLLDLVKHCLPSDQLPEFFWHHLQRDLQLLGQATGKSVDEAAIILHLVLRGILTHEPPRSVNVGVVNLGTKTARCEWETMFKDAYIQPVLEKVDENINEALDCIITDNNQEQDLLFYLVYEKVKVTEDLSPHLWTYRSRITLEHLSQTLQQQGKNGKYPILYHFLQEEHTLRATQYLPDIVRLQQCLYDSFHYRLDRKKAKQTTIGEFLKGRKSENVCYEYQGMVESLQKAWQLVGDQLKDHARLRVDEVHLIPAITKDTPLEYLIPTTTGAGACTTALVDFLVQVHNSFIERCRGIVTEQEKSNPKVTWQGNPIPLHHIHGCHLLNYENQLPSVILTHCQYSLEVGRGKDISYDWPALEKHILGRFIHGKPLIQSEIPRVVYRKDVYTAATFAAVRKKVKPQIPLDYQIQQAIIQELHSVNRIREALDVVDIVLGFLSSGGGKADRQLGEYITRALRMKKRFFSEKAREHCTLGQILSLWKTLSVELARQLILSDQDPFDAVKDEFSKELISEGEESQTVALDDCLRSVNLDHLLGTLYEFIETYVKHCPDSESDSLLVRTLDVFLDYNDLSSISHFEEVPHSITLAQTVAVWKHIVLYQDRQKREGGY